jgi:hypothetical protein
LRDILRHFSWKWLQDWKMASGCSESGMLTRSRWELLLLVCATALTRFAFRSHFLYDLDSLGFALGVEHFDPRVYQPHPPGYFLYICLGKLFHTLIPDVNFALVLLSIAASCGAAALIYKVAMSGLASRRRALPV